MVILQCHSVTRRNFYIIQKIHSLSVSNWIGGGTNSKGEPLNTAEGINRRRWSKVKRLCRHQENFLPSPTLVMSRRCVNSSVGHQTSRVVAISLPVAVASNCTVNVQLTRGSAACRDCRYSGRVCVDRGWVGGPPVRRQTCHKTHEKNSRSACRPW